MWQIPLCEEEEKIKNGKKRAARGSSRGNYKQKKQG